MTSIMTDGNHHHGADERYEDDSDSCLSNDGDIDNTPVAKRRWWYKGKFGKDTGPLESDDEITDLVEDGVINMHTLLWNELDRENCRWRSLKDIPELALVASLSSSFASGSSFGFSSRPASVYSNRSYTGASQAHYNDPTPAKFMTTSNDSHVNNNKNSNYSQNHHDHDHDISTHHPTAFNTSTRSIDQNQSHTQYDTEYGGAAWMYANSFPQSRLSQKTRTNTLYMDAFFPSPPPTNLSRARDDTVGVVGLASSQRQRWPEERSSKSKGRDTPRQILDRDRALRDNVRHLISQRFRSSNSELPIAGFYSGGGGRENRGGGRGNGRGRGPTRPATARAYVSVRGGSSYRSSHAGHRHRSRGDDYSDQGRYGRGSYDHKRQAPLSARSSSRPPSHRHHPSSSSSPSSSPPPARPRTASQQERISRQARFLRSPSTPTHELFKPFVSKKVAMPPQAWAANHGGTVTNSKPNTDTETGTRALHHADGRALNGRKGPRRPKSGGYVSSQRVFSSGRGSSSQSEHYTKHSPRPRSPEYDYHSRRFYSNHHHHHHHHHTSNRGENSHQDVVHGPYRDQHSASHHHEHRHLYSPSPNINLDFNHVSADD